ncbi:MAG TPA: TIGR01777 family oxidoreductase [Puia sp.]|nr:TIGR01777 family oxidoreductase [Puia sp.]
MSTILVAGGTGLIGTALTPLLTGHGHRVLLLSRKRSEMPATPEGQATLFHWDPAGGAIDAEAIRQADVVIQLAGAGVADKRWSDRRKRVIVESRTGSGDLLARALREIPNKVHTVISASGIGWYGADAAIPNPRPFRETDPADNSFLGETCRKWEEAIAPVASTGKRLVILRIGPVLTPNGGALKEFLKPVRMGMAAILGSGRQVFSWIHVDDLCRLILSAAEDDDYVGIYNAVAPQPVDNRTLMLHLARRIKGRYFVPVYIPSFLLKIALGELSIEVLKSATVSSDKLRNAGFQFLYPSIDSALDQLLPRH